jgi:hypothetical protein
MPVPKLTEEDKERLSSLQQRAIVKVYEHWEHFEKPINYGAIAGSINRALRKEGLSVITLVDTLVQMGYIHREPTSRGGSILLPYGLWEKLPAWKRDSWRNPSKAKTERERELDIGRKVRLLPEERDVPYRDPLGNVIPAPGAARPIETKAKPQTSQPLGQPALKDTILSILKEKSPSGLSSLEEKGNASDTDESV